MADFAAVLKKTIDGLKENTPEMRNRVYDKARATIEAKLAAVTPPPPAALADRQRQHLEDAIRVVEAEYAPPLPPVPDGAAEEDGLDRILADLDPRTIRQAPAPAPAPVPPSAATEDTPLGDEEGSWHSFEEERRAHEELQPMAGPSRPASHAPRRRKRRAGPITAVIILLLVAAAAAAAWFNRDSLESLPGYEQVAALFEGGETSLAPASEQSSQPAEEAEPSQPADAAGAESEEPASAQPEPDGAPQKFTQRLTESGEEIDEGPAGGEPTVGEGTSVAEASEAASGQPNVEGSAATPGATDSDTAQQVPVGQKAIFYEERTNSQQGSAETGTIVWSLVQESPGDDLPPEPAIRGEATIPGKNLQLRMTIKRNADKSLPASHIVEMIFLTPEDFPGGGIDNVLRISMKQSEQDTGNPLLGIPAKIADGFFLFALNDSKAEEQTNLLLMRRQEWIDIPLVYKSGRRALITMEKGIPGDKVFDQALEAWSKENGG